MKDWKIFCFLFFFSFITCKQNTEILSREQFKDILKAVIEIEYFSKINQETIDKNETIMMYQEILIQNNTTAKAFKATLDFYAETPLELKKIFDEIQSENNRKSVIGKGETK